MRSGLRDIRRRERAMRKVWQVTQALDRIASVRLSRYRPVLEAHAPYLQALARLLCGLATETNTLSAPPPAPALLLMLGADRGLCGAFHSNLAAEWIRLRQDGAAPKLIVVGRVLANSVQRLGGAMEAAWEQPPFSTWADTAQQWAGELHTRHLQLGGGAVHVLFTQFVSGVRQTAVIRPLLPAGWAAASWTNGPPANMGNAYVEPAGEICCAALETMFLRAALEHALLHSAVSEQAARHAAMSRAAESANKLVLDLGVRHHRLRQEAITTEMTEIVAGMLQA